MAATRLIAMHQQKGRSVKKGFKYITDYAQNPDKTNGGELVRSYECDPRFVETEFQMSRHEYLMNTGREYYQGNVIAYQIRQAFKPGEITPEEANRIGYETAMRWTKGKYAFIVATHVDKAHIHNHVIYNATNLSCDGKFRNFFFSGVALQHLSDLVCLENGYTVIGPTLPSERQKRSVHPYVKSFREEIRESIDICMEQKPASMDELLKLLSGMGYEIKRGKHIAVKGKGQKKYLRFRSLGAGYRQEDLERIFSGETVQKPISDSEKTEPKLDMLLDIQRIIAKGKGAGYERWAKVHNIKQIAQTLLFLEEHGIRDYETLESRAKSCSEQFNKISKRQKELESRLSEITELKKHIINYSKTREIYVEYRNSGYSKKFFEEHREEITLYKASREAFSKIEGKIPRIKDLNAEYGEVLQKKKENYSEYRKARQEMKEYQTAKYNVDRFLEKEEPSKATNQKKTKEESL